MLIADAIVLLGLALCACAVGIIWLLKRKDDD